MQVDPLAATEGNGRYDGLHVATIVPEISHVQRVHY